MIGIQPAYPLVSIITVNFNQSRVTGEFLHSVQQVTYPNVEIIVVDNASTEPGSEGLEATFPQVIFIRNAVNKGFAGGNNAGVKAARGEYLLFINNDTEVAQDFLEPLIACMQHDPGIGMASPKIKYHHNKHTIQYAGGSRINPFTGRGRFIGSGLPDTDAYNHTCRTQLIHGAAMIVSRAMIEKTGLMEETFFLYYEELDWCERAKKAGFSLYYVGQSVVYHKESVSVGKNSPLKEYYLTRNRLLFARRNYNRWQLSVNLLFFTLLSFPKTVISYILRGNFHLLKAFLKGIAWHLYPETTCYSPVHPPESSKTNKSALTPV